MNPSEPALQLARRLAALPETQMRERVLVEYLGQVTLQQAVQVLDEIYRFGRQGGPPFNVALLAVASALSGGLLDYEILSQLYETAKQEGLATLTQLFLSSQESDREVRRKDEQFELTLGHRKWMARSPKRQVLERLLQNPEAEVIHNLLKNPRLTEQDVVLLAARRPALPDVQQEIFSSRRWLARYAVKRALVLNPYTPTELSLRLLGFITTRDQMLIKTSPTLPEPLREAAERLLEDSGTRQEKQVIDSTESPLPDRLPDNGDKQET
jgi:hypothetical protein